MGELLRAEDSTAMKAGDIVLYRGGQWVFVMDNGAMVEISRAGGRETKHIYQKDIVPLSWRATPSTNGRVGRPLMERDLFEELVPQLEALAVRLTTDGAAAGARVARRQEQVRRLKKAIDILSVGRGRNANNFICRDCGKHKASKIHKAPHTTGGV